jgi:putative heme-binding domain-containing protein
VEILANLLSPQSPSELQSAAAEAFGRPDDDKVLEQLLEGWASYTPRLRAEILDVALSRPTGLNSILDALGQSQISPQEIPLPSQQRLLEHADAAVRERASKVFIERADPDRSQVVSVYEMALSMRGNPNRGMQVFAKNCSACHRLGVLGTAVGPDLAMTRDKPAEWFLPAIFDPSRAVDARYLNYSVLTEGGNVISGVPAEESGTSITLIDTQGKRHVVLRSNIEEFTCTNKSIMPDGFENQLKPQDVADVISFLQHPKASPKDVEFNEPELVRPRADGTLQLLAVNCEIFGDEIHVWDRFGCLGWWTSEDDQAVWTFELPRPGRYAVSLEWSSDDESAGNEYAVEVGDKTLTGIVQSSGGWETYREEKIGEVYLDAGVSTLTVRSLRGIRPGSYLFDLRGVELHPIAVDQN